MTEKLIYKDEDGTKLYGYSQRDMDKTVKWVKYGVILGYLMFAFILFLFWYIIANNVVNNIVARCM